MGGYEVETYTAKTTFILGPLPLFLVFASETSLALCMLRAYGNPDLFFRGESGVVLAYLVSVVGAVLFGVPLGIAIQWGLIQSSRSIAFANYLVITLLLAILFGLPRIYIELENNKLLHPAMQLALPFADCLLCGIAATIASYKNASAA